MKNSKRGIGMVEVLVAGAVLVALLYALALSLGVADRGSKSSRESVFVDMVGESLLNSLAGMERDALWAFLNGTAVVQGTRSWYGTDPAAHAPWLQSWAPLVNARAIRFRVELIPATGARLLMPGAVRPAVAALDDFAREFLIEIDFDPIGSGSVVTRRYSRLVPSTSCEL
jgi:hypothetical protein